MVVNRGAALLRFALMLCGDTHLAEDLVQTVLAEAYRRWSRISAVDQPEAYLKKMIVNEYLAWRRRRSNREVVMSAPTSDEQHNPSDLHANHHAAWALLSHLPRQQRAVLVLRYYEDLSDAQIAAILSCATSTVRSNATRALATLRAVIPSLDQEALP